MELAYELQPQIHLCIPFCFPESAPFDSLEKYQMKSLYALAAIVALSAAPVFAGEGHVSAKSLNNMGLAGMKAMDDAQGMQVRGLAVVVVSGKSIAGIGGNGGGAASTNSYFAAGKHSAEGSNLSFAVDGTVTTHGNHVSSTTNFVAAGGFSQAAAK